MKHIKKFENQSDAALRAMDVNDIEKIEKDAEKLKKIIKSKIDDAVTAFNEFYHNYYQTTYTEHEANIHGNAKSGVIDTLVKSLSNLPHKGEWLFNHFDNEK